MVRPAGFLGHAKTVVRVTYACDVKYPAAALAYYGFVSFVPLLLLALAVLGRQFGDEIATRSPRFLTPEAQQLVYEALTTASGRAGAALLAVGVLAWSAANVAADFLTVVERVEGTSAGSVPEQLGDGVVVLGAVSTAIVTIVLTSVLFAEVGAGVVAAVFESLLLLVALTVTFVPLYYAPSEVVATPTAALPGAVTAATGWTVIHTAIQFYADHAGFAIYGVLSGLIIILTSLYFAASVLMVGVVVNATLAEGSEPSPVGDAE